MTYRKLLLSTAAAAALVACGGNGNGNVSNITPDTTNTPPAVVRTVEPTETPYFTATPYAHPTPQPTATQTQSPYPILRVNRYTDDPAINFSSLIFSDGRLEHRYKTYEDAYECSGSVPRETIDQMLGVLHAVKEERLGRDASFLTGFEELDKNGIPADSFTYTGDLVVTDRGTPVYSAPEIVRQLVSTAEGLGPYPGIESPIATNCRQISTFERFQN